MTALALDVKIAKPGVFEDIPDAVYHADPVEGGSLSSTGARALLPPNCPAKFRYEQLHGRKAKREFDVGHAAHHLVLGTGPELKLLEFDDYRKKDAQIARDEAYAAGQVPLLLHEYDLVEDMALALREDPAAGPLLDPSKGRTELTLVWKDVQTGVMLRARIDFARPAPDSDVVYIIDYKTAKSSEPSAIERMNYDRGYHQQMAFYCEGALETGLTGKPVPLLVVQEKTPPYVVTVSAITKTAYDWGTVLNRAAINLYSRCLATDTWPGYATDIIASGVPGWAERGYEQALDRGDYNIKGIKK
ncbi:PD-(D/E)XK nuclease-like domain-containing protein [Amycolatopsis lurida]|uniref:PD-(D/E)XK nuclease-like domain-containing protein n=1 Tax=Amycolatopsis lurida TaxID=31959 RepID=UPI0036513CB2